MRQWQPVLVSLVLAVMFPASVWSASVFLMTHADSHELHFMVQTETETLVQIVVSTPDSLRECGKSHPMMTRAEHRFRVPVIIEDLQAGRHYTATLLENGIETKQLTVSTAPTLPASYEHYQEESFAMVSGAFGLNATHALGSINALKPTAVFWVGNSVSQQSTARTPTGYLQAWEQLQMRMSTSQLHDFGIPHYAVLGVNEYGPTGASGRYWGRSASLNAYLTAWNNPFLHLPLGTSNREQGYSNNALGDRSYSMQQGVSLSQDTTTKAACWSMRRGAVEFFVLDGFSFRDSENAQYLGQTQLAWLESALDLSTAPVKVVLCGTPLLHPLEHPMHWVSCKEEYAPFMRRIESTKITGLLFVTASVSGYGEMTRLSRAGNYPLYELTLGNLLEISPTMDVPRNYRREPGTLVREHHFALLSIRDGPYGIAVKITVYDQSGAALWADTLNAEDLGIGTGKSE